MVTADDARAHVRTDIASLVENYCQAGYPRMRAYDRVASSIGRSSAWIQRILSRDERATVGLHDFLNIRAAYDRVCARIETAADALEAQNEQIRERAHAACESAETADASAVGLVPLVVEPKRQQLSEGGRA